MEFIIITGMSGAGKSQAVNILEDMGYYCMDNLPPTLLPKFAQLCIESKKSIDKVAVVLDIRTVQFFENLFKGLYDLNDMGIEYKVLFLEATDEDLIMRYKEKRRPHPLNREGSISLGIEKERKRLYEIKIRSDFIIDTSNYKVADLRDHLYNILVDGDKKDRFSLFITSFGFKYGTLLDGDLIFDVRFLPNPYYLPELKEKTGNDKEVRDYVFKWKQTGEFVDKLVDMLEFLIPHYIEEGKSQLIIGIGCTGGQHRSVSIANQLNEIMQNNGHRTSVSHRDS